MNWNPLQGQQGIVLSIFSKVNKLIGKLWNESFKAQRKLVVISSCFRLHWGNQGTRQEPSGTCKSASFREASDLAVGLFSWWSNDANKVATTPQPKNLLTQQYWPGHFPPCTIKPGFSLMIVIKMKYWNCPLIKTNRLCPQFNLISKTSSIQGDGWVYIKMYLLYNYSSVFETSVTKPHLLMVRNHGEGHKIFLSLEVLPAWKV